MFRFARRTKPLILVSGDYDPGVWRTCEDDETDFQSWLAVVQDVWGRGCFRCGQASAMREAANALPLDKRQLIGAVGALLGGLSTVAAESAAHIDVFECSAPLLTFLQQERAGGKYLKLGAFDPGSGTLRPGRYHGLIAAGAFAAVPDVADLATEIAGALKKRGRLIVEELYVDDPSVAALIGQGISGPAQRLAPPPQSSVMNALAQAGMTVKWKVSTNEALMAAIVKGLSQAQEVAQRLKGIPQPFRTQRMSAFADELQRSAVLYQALQKGLAVGLRTKHTKA